MSVCRSTIAIGAVSALAGVSTRAHAYSFDVRFVERVGNTDVVLSGNTIHAGDHGVHNIRIQMGVFDDANSAAPDGGVLGWVGSGASLSVSGSASNSDERRNPGRLSPYTFSSRDNANGNPPLPSGDPFTTLTDIDNTLGQQALPWFCDASGNPAPMPQPTIYGRNQYVSIYAFSIDPAANGVGYAVTATGGYWLARAWNAFSVIEPDCSDPSNPVAGSVLWLPFPIANGGGPTGTFSRTLTVTVPAPAGAACMGLAMVTLGRRSRRQVRV